MKRTKIVITLLLLVFVVLFFTKDAYAKNRNIYVGDLIKLKITSRSISEEEIRDKFTDFEIVDLKKEEDGYQITLRSFEVGEKIIQIGEQELKITVHSTLKDIERTDLYEGDLDPVRAGFSQKVQYIFYSCALIFIITGAITLIRGIKSRKIAALNPFQNFHKQLEVISLTEEDYFVKLSKCLKSYLEASYSCSLNGKTTSEIIEELMLVPDLQIEIEALHSWLLESDIYKYTKTAASMEQKQKAAFDLKELVNYLEERKGVEACFDSQIGIS